MRRAAVEGILNQLADDFRTRRKIPQVGRWSRHRLATARHFEILEHRSLSDNCSRSGGDDQIVRHSHHSSTHKNLQVRRSSLRFTSGLHLLIILRAISIDQLLSPELRKMVAAQVSNGKTLRNPRASQPFGQLLSERRQRPDCQTLSHHSYTHKKLQVRRSSLRFTSGLHL